MGFFRRIAGFLGFGGKDETDQVVKDLDDDVDARNPGSVTRGPRKGFSVPVQVPVDHHRSSNHPQIGPVLVECDHQKGGIQGLKWHANRLRMDEDGDVADEFLEEVLPDTSSETRDHQHSAFPKLVVKSHLRRAKVKKQVMSIDGKFRQCVEHQGRLQWV